MSSYDADNTQFLVKFGREEHMRALLRRGAVFMNQLQYFVDLEKDGLRGDRNEALTGYWSHERAKITIGGRQLLPAGPLRVWGAPDRRRATYCLYGVSNLRDPVDPRCFTFGDLAVFFSNGQEFARRVFAAAERLGHELALEPVRYVGRDYCGPMGAFTKLSEFSFQNEWRMVTRDPTPGPLLLEVGSLEDIAMAVPLSELAMPPGGCRTSR